MKRYYIVAVILFCGIVTQTEAGVMPNQPGIPDAMGGSIPQKIQPGIMGAMPGAIQPTNIPSPKDVLPSSTGKGVIAHVSVPIAQKALDDSSAFILNDGYRVACFGVVDQLPISGFVKPAENNQPAKCNTLDPNTGKITAVSLFKIPASNTPFEWRSGSAANPDEWATGTKQIPTADAVNPVTGICAQKHAQSNKPILLGSAVRKQGTQHICVLPNGIYPLSHDQVIVLVK